MWKVMVVDDERPALEELSECLAMHQQVGEIYRFQTSREALAKFPELLPDLVFLDIEMPGMRGLELAENLLAFGTGAEIVFVTAYNQYALAAFDLFALDYILKPLDAMRLQKSLEKFSKVAKQKLNSAPHVQQNKSVRLFGPITVTGPSGTMTWNSSKSKELFAYLLLHRQVTIDRMIDDVFAEFAPEKAIFYVHTCMYRIRKSLKECGLDEAIKIEYRNKRYETALTGGLHIDYDQFLRAEGANQRVERYAGDLLPEVTAIWKYPFQKQCDDVYESALQEALQMAKETGNLKLAEQYAERLRQFVE